MAEFKKLATLLQDTLENLDRKTLISLEYFDDTGEVAYQIVEDKRASSPTDIQQIAWGLMKILEEDFEEVLQKGQEVFVEKQMETLEPLIKDNVIAFKKRN